MEDEKTRALPESKAMNGGEGPCSYAQNSSYQRGVVEAAKIRINEAIANHFDIESHSTSLSPVFIADLGCSAGPNTLIAVQNIVEAIDLKYKSKGLNTQISEFLVFFNDHVSNDFNTLFKSLPPNRQYFAAGVPGSFYGRLFPKASLHFMHSSCALNWLSRVPRQVMDEGSPAWNKGRIHYTNAPREVVEAYATWFAKDMESFLTARAQELVVGGLLALFVPAIPDVMSNSETFTGTEMELLGSCLIDVVKVGLVSIRAINDTHANHMQTMRSLRPHHVSQRIPSMRAQRNLSEHYHHLLQEFPQHIILCKNRCSYNVRASVHYTSCKY